MRFAIGVLLVAACATKQAPPPANAARTAEADRPTEQARGVRIAKLTPDVVLATIRGRYINGVERCYRRHLKKDAGARGRVLVSFAVDAKGRAREGQVRGIAERVDDCIEAQVRRWRFPIPRGHVESRFALGLQLGAR